MVVGVSNAQILGPGRDHGDAVLPVRRVKAYAVKVDDLGTVGDVVKHDDGGLMDAASSCESSVAARGKVSGRPRREGGERVGHGDGPCLDLVGVVERLDVGSGCCHSGAEGATSCRNDSRSRGAKPSGRQRGKVAESGKGACWNLRQVVANGTREGANDRESP